MKQAKELCSRLISYFTFEPGEVPPGFSGFRAREGLSLKEFRELSKREDFKAAVEEAKERYLDTLVAGALLKQYDAGFVKHLLSLAEAEGPSPGDEALTVTVQVVE